MRRRKRKDCCLLLVLILLETYSIYHQPKNCNEALVSFTSSFTDTSNKTLGQQTILSLESSLLCSTPPSLHSFIRTCDYELIPETL